MLPYSAIWLIPGEHPVFMDASRVLRGIFRRFQTLDYREMYLTQGRRSLECAIESERAGRNADIVLYTQFPSSFAYIHPHFLAHLRNLCAVIGFGWDDEMYFEQAKYLYQACSALITTDETAVNWLKEVGVATYLAPLHYEAASVDITEVTQDISVSFVGDMTKPGRRYYVDYLERNGVPVQDYGFGSRHGRVENAENIFRRSRINLNFVGTNSPTWIARHDAARATLKQIKSRPFELASLRCFCLCEWTPAVDRWFQEGKQIATFRDADDLVIQAKKYLADETSRSAIATAAHAKYESELRLSVYLERLFPRIMADLTGRVFENPSTSAAVYAESVGRSRGVSVLHALRRFAPLRAVEQLFGECAGTMSYWRGFAGGIRDAINNQVAAR